MGKLCALILAVAGFAEPSCAYAQAGSNWDRVKALDPGTTIHVRGERGRGVTCNVMQVEDSELVCARPHRILFFTTTDHLVFRRNQVREVRFTRRLLSSVVGAGIGIGAGVGLGYGLENAATRAEDPGLLQFTFGFLGGILGQGIGQGTDFLGGPVIYRAH